MHAGDGEPRLGRAPLPPGPHAHGARVTGRIVGIGADGFTLVRLGSRIVSLRLGGAVGDVVYLSPDRIARGRVHGTLSVPLAGAPHGDAPGVGLPGGADIRDARTLGQRLTHGWRERIGAGPRDEGGFDRLWDELTRLVDGTPFAAAPANDRRRHSDPRSRAATSRALSGPQVLRRATTRPSYLFQLVNHLRSHDDNQWVIIPLAFHADSVAGTCSVRVRWDRITRRPAEAIVSVSLERDARVHWVHLGVGSDGRFREDARWATDRT